MSMSHWAVAALFSFFSIASASATECVVRCDLHGTKQAVSLSHPAVAESDLGYMGRAGFKLLSRGVVEAEVPHAQCMLQFPNDSQGKRQVGQFMVNLGNLGQFSVQVIDGDSGRAHYRNGLRDSRLEHAGEATCTYFCSR
jgi:hypothetical protein